MTAGDPACSDASARLHSASHQLTSETGSILGVAKWNVRHPRCRVANTAARVRGPSLRISRRSDLPLPRITGKGASKLGGSIYNRARKMRVLRAVLYGACE
jgi:hypothetical protein